LEQGKGGNSLCDLIQLATDCRVRHPLVSSSADHAWICIWANSRPQILRWRPSCVDLGYGLGPGRSYPGPKESMVGPMLGLFDDQGGAGGPAFPRLRFSCRSLADKFAGEATWNSVWTGRGESWPKLPRSCAPYWRGCRMH